MSESKTDRPDPKALEKLERLAQQLEGTWCAMPNDLIGGWCVMPGPEPPSAGAAEIADFCQQEVAEFVALAQNMLPGLIAQIRRLDADTAAMRSFLETELDWEDFRSDCLGQEATVTERDMLAALEAYNAALRQQLAMSAEWIAAQSELLSRKAETKEPC